MSRVTKNRPQEFDRFKRLRSKLACGYQGYLSIYHLRRYSYLVFFVIVIPKQGLTGTRPPKPSFGITLIKGPMKGGLSVECRLEILRNVQHRLGN